MNAKPSISVIIPAYSAERTIGAQLEALSEQASGARDIETAWELIVADNGSPDGTADVAASFAGRLPVRVVDASARRGPSAARNIGAAEALGPMLVFTDADDVVVDGWLRAWFRWAAAADDRSLAAGLITRAAPPVAAPPSHGCMPPTHMRLPFASGNNFGVGAALFEELGGFDEERFTGEDIDFCWRAMALGVEVECVPSLVRVATERGEWATLRRYYEYGLGDPPLYRDHRLLGAARPAWRSTSKSYVGLIARVPLLMMRRQRERWLHQLGRRTGRLVGSARTRTWYP